MPPPIPALRDYAVPAVPWSDQPADVLGGAASAGPPAGHTASAPGRCDRCRLLEDFCSPECQQAWYRAQADVADLNEPTAVGQQLGLHEPAAERKLAVSREDISAFVAAYFQARAC